MTIWTVTFQDSPEMTKIRADRVRRDAHIAYVRGHPELQIGGPLALRPQQDFPGAIWTVEVESRVHVEGLVLNDPYYIPSLRNYQISDLETVPEAERRRKPVPESKSRS